MERTNNIYEEYYPYLLFAIVLLVSNMLWKVSIVGDEQACAVVTLWGMDVSYYFDLAVRHLTECVYAVVHLFEPSVRFRHSSMLIFDNGNSMRIVWSCTPIKQMFIWLCIMIAAPRQSWHKCWYIPLGWVIIYGINILRISILKLLIYHHRSLFPLMHDYLLKYAFYLILFMMFVVYMFFSDRWKQTRNSHMPYTQ